MLFQFQNTQKQLTYNIMGRMASSRLYISIVLISESSHLYIIMI